jgi:hypothetical protein
MTGERSMNLPDVRFVARGGGIRAAVFDLDDTLIASERARRRCLRGLLDSDEAIQDFHRASRYWFERYKAGLCTADEQRCNRWIAIGIPRETALTMDEEYRAYHGRIHKRRGSGSASRGP